uniref:Uncharacterized protein n=1 Tax=Arundo donax TaxID=35708 RepID=A0A0A9EDK3_ARUDO
MMSIASFFPLCRLHHYKRAWNSDAVPWPEPY